jgi:hypothetical protein
MAASDCKHAIHQLASCLSSAARGQQPLPVLLAVAEASPDVFQEHLLLHMSPDTKRALNASCQLASSHVRAAVTSITFSNESLYGTPSKSSLPAADPAIRYPAVVDLHLDMSSGVGGFSEFPSELDIQMLQSVCQYTQLFRQLKHLKVQFPDHGAFGGVDLEAWWKLLLETISSCCIQLESFTAENLQGTSFCWKAPQLPSQQLHVLLAELSAILLDFSSDEVVSASCSLQSLVEVSIHDDDRLGVLLYPLQFCTALSRLEFTLVQDEDVSDTLQQVMDHTSLQHATIYMNDCQPTFDPSDPDNQALLQQVAACSRDRVQIHLSTREGVDPSDLLALCSIPCIQSLDLSPHLGGSPSLTDTWTHFALLQSLELNGCLLDDCCVTALNRLMLLRKVKLGLEHQDSHQILTRHLTSPSLLEFVAELQYATAAGVDQQATVDAHASWQLTGLFIDTLLLSENLTAALQAPLLRQCTLQGGLVPAQAFLQLQQRSPHLQLELCKVVLLVDDMQLAAVAKHCPQLLSSGSCVFRSITHYGLLSAATAAGSSLKELCGSAKTCDERFLVIEHNHTIRVAAGDGSISTLAQKCTNLTKLQLISSTGFAQPSIMSIAAHLPALRVLELLGCKGLDEGCLCALVRGCQRLAQLSLDGLGSIPEVALCLPLLDLESLQTLALTDAHKLSITGLRMFLTRSKALQRMRLWCAGSANLYECPSRELHSKLSTTSQEMLDAWGTTKI